MMVRQTDDDEEDQHEQKQIHSSPTYKYPHFRGKLQQCVGGEGEMSRVNNIKLINNYLITQYPTYYHFKMLYSGQRRRSMSCHKMSNC